MAIIGAKLWIFYNSIIEHYHDAGCSLQIPITIQQNILFLKLFSVVQQIVPGILHWYLDLVLKINVGIILIEK